MTPGTDADRLALTGLARHVIATVLGVAAAPPVHSPILDACRGAFVTLSLQHRLRGCMGHVRSDEPLRALVAAMARAAAFEDPRFPPLTTAELPLVLIEVSVLSRPLRAPAPEAVIVGTHGVIVSAGGRRALLLPQVAVEWNWSREELLAQCCEKASLDRDAWRQPSTRLETFTADVFAEMGA